jgi:Na+-transporting methylmalonyl-CoA/oxaloacetate decarboxylase gamma subunit
MMKRFAYLLMVLPGLCLANQQALDKIKTDHGLSLAISGMLIVFIGLAAISICIALLPRALKLLEKKERQAPIQLIPMGNSEDMSPAMLSAIAFVLHAEAERAAGLNLKITLDLHPSPWALSNQMRQLPGRIKS